jgi:hypothetical protein
MDFSNVRVGPPEEVTFGAKRAIDSRISEIRNAGVEIEEGTDGSCLVGSDSWFVELALKPTVTLELHKLNRLDLALEHVVLDPTWASAFPAELRVRANRNLMTVKRFSELERELELTGRPESQVDISQDKLVISGSRIFWVCAAMSIPSETSNYCARSELLELELMSSSFLPYSAEHHRHVLFCQQCRSGAPVLTDIMETLVDLDLRLFKGRLQVLAATQNVGHDRVDELLRVQPPDLRDDWLQAAELLGSRALVTANYLSDLIQLQHLVPQDTNVPAWSVLRRGAGHPRAADFLQRLDRRLLQSGIAAALLTQMWYHDPWVVQEEEFKIPTDGDISDYAWAVPVATNPDLDHWQAALSYRPATLGESRPFLRELVETVQIAASTETGSGPSDATMVTSTASDLLENVRDMVWINSQRVEELARKLGPPEDEIRKRLCELLGPELLDRLGSHSRQLLIDAERIFADGHITSHLALWAIGLAFEIQVMKSVLPLVRDSLRGEENLNSIEKFLLLGCPDNIRQRFSHDGLDATQVGLAISRVRPAYNRYKHKEVSPPREEVREVRESWYGLRPGILGVFQAITGFPSRNPQNPPSAN